MVQNFAVNVPADGGVPIEEEKKAGISNSNGDATHAREMQLEAKAKRKLMDKEKGMEKDMQQKPLASCSSSASLPPAGDKVVRSAVSRSPPTSSHLESNSKMQSRSKASRQADKHAEKRRRKKEEDATARVATKSKELPQPTRIPPMLIIGLASVLLMFALFAVRWLMQ